MKNIIYGAALVATLFSNRSEGMLKNFQSLIYSNKIDNHLIASKITELKNHFPPNVIDDELLTAMALNYERVHYLAPYLSKNEVHWNELFQHDFEFLAALYKAGIKIRCKSFDTEIFSEKCGWQRQVFQTGEDFFEQINLKCAISDSPEEIEYIEATRDNGEKLLYGQRTKTPLERAIDRDDIDTFRLLTIENNFNFNGMIARQNTLYHYNRVPILCYCIQKKAMKCFKHALINGADPSKRQDPKRSFSRSSTIVIRHNEPNAYAFAGAIGNIQIIKMIEDQGLQVTGQLARWSAYFHQNHIIKWIAREHINLLPEAWSRAIRSNNLEAIDIIMESGIDINIPSHNRHNTPLHLAVKHDKKWICEILINNGANIEAKDLNGYTPAHIATLYNKKEILKLLLDKGADVNTTDRMNSTPLHTAAFCNNQEMVELLLNNGADINAQTDNGTTPREFVHRDPSWFDRMVEECHSQKK